MAKIRYVQKSKERIKTKEEEENVCSCHKGGNNEKIIPKRFS